VIMSKPSFTFTGRRRRRTTRWRVSLSNSLAHVIIAVGGIGTIVAVSLVCVFLVWVVVPLFLPATVEKGAAVRVQGSGFGGQEADRAQGAGGGAQAETKKILLALGVDDYRLTGWEIDQSGAIRVFRLDNAKTLQHLSAEEAGLTGVSAASVAIDGQTAAFGFDSGNVQVGEIHFDYQVVPPGDLPADVQKIAPGEVAELDGGALVARTEQGDFRRQKFALKLQPPQQVAAAMIVRLDHVATGSGTRLCTLAADGKLRISSLSMTHNEITDEDKTELTGSDLPLPKADTPPDYVLISDRGDNVFVAWRDGRLLRFLTRNVRQPQLEEEVHLTPPGGTTLTALSWLLGRNTLVAGDSQGRVRAWFTKEADESGRGSDEAVPPDHHVLVAAHDFAAVGQAVTSIVASPRARLVAVGFNDGQIKLLYVAAERVLAELKYPQQQAVGTLAISPKGNCLLAAAGDGIMRWNFDARHPEATLGMLFLPVWYEGHPQSEHAWESTGSSDASEAKFGLMPLVFGTLKATIYTMLFGAPLALLAAIYSSEFLHPRLKSRIKPTIEMMASLPSVVLGFLAGLVVAPFVESFVAQTLTCIFTVPLSFLLGAYLWQLLPSDAVVRLSRFRLIFIMLMMPVGILAGVRLGSPVEQWLFAGNIKEWLDGQRGSGAGGWVLLLLPLAALFTAVLLSQQVNPWLRRLGAHWSRTQAGLVELLKFVLAVAFTIGVSVIVAFALDALKLDPRGTLVGTYVQRNALVVGFAMGFAIIPLIYTIADDALSTVPEHLRSASLGAGATPWQTAVRIVIPTAASGLFSALMIGLGRAVGETMIVLMAAGNTPLMDCNIFQGFETLSMALATELPEAAKNSTHYRVLFLAALTLFAVTFVVNTVAEMVRQRFRRRAYEL
jgi:phosphate transport system permease protein